ncbi:hypothetical protein AT15_05525 [Kosmotoga arenicorallina S304]|uniref:PrcB C-terminal domain-containing protein n=1 Tax=Kosmotoga arenicorallina S304 TaxID=1453497 RepID=A0A182C7Z8_9BACT|nr:protease complex subunit PrcB family protein [Kosmotoga arenicorallina]OAA31534.1 hypothetical protein AT15_05525 [Kosmotoga arenicorallina S304]
MKRTVLFSLLLLLISMGVQAVEGVIVMPVKMPCDDSLYEHFGSRTANIQILDLSCPEENLYVFILKGWLFLPNSEIHSGETTLKLVGRDTNFEKTLSLKRNGSYLTLEPRLLLLSKDIKTVEVMGVLVDISELVSVKLPFEVVKFPIDAIKEAGVFPVSVEGNSWDFSEKLPGNRIFLIVSAGEKPTGGYSLEVGKVNLYKHKITMEATLTYPPKGAFVTQVLTYPAVMLKLPELLEGEYELELVLLSEQDGMRSAKSYKNELIVTSPE